jgi:hypothetical protein
MDGKITNEDLNERWQAFATARYDTYLERLDGWCSNRGYPSIYHLPIEVASEAVACEILDELAKTTP